MKRTLAFLLYVGMATAGAGQTATVVEKPAAKQAGTAVPAKQKPSPLASGVKVTPVTAKPVAAPAKGAQAAKPGTQVVVVPKDKNPFSKKPASGAKRSAGQAAQSAKNGDEPKVQAVMKIGAAGRRDPFVSPVVNLSAIGSGCSSGKRCLSIEQIALRGVVRSDTGMIAVVVNALDKAYFLRENDPVFNGYVEKITADSIVFRETFHDRLGKAFTRDVTKSISRPAA